MLAAANDPAPQPPDRVPPPVRVRARNAIRPGCLATRFSHRRIIIPIPDLRQVGKYAVSSSTLRDDGGLFGACVAIRSGRGSMTHQRVIRFAPRFDSHDEALVFAREQACAWIGEQDAPRPSLAKE